MPRVYVREVNYCNDCPNHFLRGGPPDYEHACMDKCVGNGSRLISPVTFEERDYSQFAKISNLCEIPDWCPLQIIPRFEDVTP